MKVVRVILRQLDNKKLKNQSGVSLIEMLFVILLIFTIVALVTTVLVSTQNTNRDIINIVRSEIDARLVLYKISKDIRETHNIVSASEYEVIFDTNTDSDEYYERVRYFLSDNDGHYDLYRQVDNGTSDLFIENIVDGSIFTYYSGLSTPEGGMAMAMTEEEMDSIKYVDITVNIDQSGSQGPKTMTLSTMITLRNRIY